VNAALLDAGVIVALMDRREKFHRVCADSVDVIQSPLVTCEPVIGEACYLLREVRGAAEAVMDNIASGVFQIPFQLSSFAVDVSRLIRKYTDLPASLADACLIQLANQLGTGDILTLDSDFRIYRWGTNKPFRLLIDLP